MISRTTALGALLVALSGCTVVRATPAPIYEGHAVAVDPGGHQAVVAMGVDGVGPGTFTAAGDGYLRAHPSLDVHLTAGFATTLAGLGSMAPMLATSLSTNTLSAGFGAGLRGRIRLGSDGGSPTLGLGGGFGGGVAEADTTSGYYGAWSKVGLAVPLGPGDTFFDVGASFTEDQWRLRPRRAHLVGGYRWSAGVVARSVWIGVAAQRGGFSCVDQVCSWDGEVHASIGPRVGVTVELVPRGAGEGG